MNNEFQNLAGQVADWMWKCRPVAGTQQGYHVHDERFAIFNVETLKELMQEGDALSMQLRRLREGSISPLETQLRDLLRATVEIATAEVEPMEYHSRAADLYVAEIMNGLHVLIAREDVPIDERAPGVLGRLRGIWRVLREGMANLRAGRNVPKIWTENAILITEAALRYYETVLADFISKVGDEATRLDLLDSVSTSRSAIEHYLNFLRLDMLASSKGKFAVGKEHFTLLLRQRHRLKVSLADLVVQSDEMVAQARRDLEVAARDIHPSRSWQEIINELRAVPQEPEELLEKYRAQLDRARDFAVAKGLVSLVPGERLVVSWTPGHLRHIYPYQAEFGAPAFEKKPIGSFHVSGVEPNRHEDIRLQQLQGHFPAQMPLAAVLFGYPGLHVFDMHRQAIADPSVKFHQAGFLREGWKAYAAEIMDQAGFFSDPFERLVFLRHRLLNALRLQIDVKLHTQEMTLEECADLLSLECGLEPANAEREARRYASAPTHQMAHVLGLKQILELRQQAEARDGKAFSLRKFHDALLACGQVPADVAEVILRDGLTKPLALVGAQPKAQPTTSATTEVTKSAATPAAESRPAAAAPAPAANGSHRSTSEPVAATARHRRDAEEDDDDDGVISLAPSKAVTRLAPAPKVAAPVATPVAAPKPAPVKPAVAAKEAPAKDPAPKPAAKKPEPPPAKKAAAAASKPPAKMAAAKAPAKKAPAKPSKPAAKAPAKAAKKSPAKAKPAAKKPVAKKAPKPAPKAKAPAKPVAKAKAAPAKATKAKAKPAAKSAKAAPKAKGRK